jgi:transposase
LSELEAFIETGSKWAKEMATFLLKLYQESEKATKVLSNKGCYYIEYAAICAQADFEEPQPIKKPKGKPLNSKGRNLLNRLLKHKDAVLAFAFEPYVPFTNNTAERDIRHVKVKQKVAMSFRTFHGAEVYAHAQSFVATVCKQKQNAFQQLCRILNGEQYAFQRTRVVTPKVFSIQYNFTNLVGFPRETQSQHKFNKFSFW